MRKRNFSILDPGAPRQTSLTVNKPQSKAPYVDSSTPEFKKENDGNVNQTYLSENSSFVFDQYMNINIEGTKVSTLRGPED